ncbi:motif protein trim9 [Anaeramoeba flamelloides]|uniref:Motif protein trim9 n=1 Tax=Anaeramoeba flamelloides TaxID=1746091 RepID=A0ABQ8YQZ2_9EUKA|nr:motif protein trim9 [Anaeramoeba flamelloides]
MDNSKNHQKMKRSKHKQKAYKKNKYKQKNKNKNKKHSKKEKKITKLSQITQPVEKRIPKCENCNKKQSQFYCPKCEVYYCAKCEEQLHKMKVLKKHKKHLYKAPYNELVKSLNDFSNEIYEKVKIILNKIQNEENQNEKTIQKSLENQNKLKEKIKNICQKIENDSDLLIQKIQDSKINYLNLFKKIEIIIDNKIQTILEDTKKKQKRILKKKIKINTIQKLKKDKNHIKLIQGGKEIIKLERKSEKNGKKGEEAEKEQKRKRKMEKRGEQGVKEIIKSEGKSEKKGKKKKKKKKGREKEKEKRKEKKGKEKEKGKLDEKDEFDPEMNRKIKLKNENKTVWNPNNGGYWGTICGKKIYSSGKHEIKIKIDQFPNPKNESNQINLGIIKTENRENFIKKRNWEGTYFFETIWNYQKKKLESRKCKKENGKWTEKIYPEEI